MSVCVAPAAKPRFTTATRWMNLANVVFLVSLDRNVKCLSATPHAFPLLQCVSESSQRAPAQAPFQGPQLLPGIFSSTEQLPSGLFCTGCSFFLAIAAWRSARCGCSLPQLQWNPCFPKGLQGNCCSSDQGTTSSSSSPLGSAGWFLTLVSSSFLSLSTAVHTYRYHRHTGQVTLKSRYWVSRSFLQNDFPPPSSSWSCVLEAGSVFASDHQPGGKFWCVNQTIHSIDGVSSLPSFSHLTNSNYEILNQCVLMLLFPVSMAWGGKEYFVLEERKERIFPSRNINYLLCPTQRMTKELLSSLLGNTMLGKQQQHLLYGTCKMEANKHDSAL